MESNAASPGRSYEVSAKTLVTQETIWAKTAECARRIAADYANCGLSLSNPLVLVCVLKGSFIFTADLARFLSDNGVPVQIEFLCVSSYGTGVTSSGQVKLLLDVRSSLESRHVMIVEDIVDTAITLKYLLALFEAKKPASLKTVVLFDKPEGRKVQVEVDYAVTRIPNEFVIGYGLDFNENMRELRDVCVLKPSYYQVAHL